MTIMTHPIRAEIRPHLILVIGTPGVGKTTLSRAIAKARGCPRVEKDHISDPLAAHGLVAPEHRAMTYRIIANFADSLLAECGQVLVEAPLKRYLREWDGRGQHPLAPYAEMAGRADGMLSVIHAGCDPDIVLERILHRDHRRDERKVESADAFARFLEVEPIELDPGLVEGYEVLDLDTGRADALDLALAWLTLRECAQITLAA